MNEVDYITSIISPLVQYPENIKIIKKVDEMGVLLTVSLDRTDMGKIIGVAGHTANAIRTLMKVYGIGHDLHISLKIDEPQYIN